MQVTDFQHILDAAGLRNGHGGEWLVTNEDIYEGSEAFQHRSPGRDASIEMVRLCDGAFLIASSCMARAAQLQRQIVSNTDWLHIQFRLNGGGCERILSQVVETPERACVVVRYPKNSVIDRTNDMTRSWKAACLLISPRALTELLDTPAARLPESVSWMAAPGQRELQTRILPLQAAFVLTVNDIFACSFQGDIRRAFMRAKSLELLSNLINALNTPVCGSPEIRLSGADRHKLSLARRIMSDHLDSTLTLDQLSRRVGLNRTKLAVGFKMAYGISVQAYWRDAKLGHARELLAGGAARVTEVALSLGYAELSSFTRAFRRKFGESPRACRENLSSAKGTASILA